MEFLLKNKVSSNIKGYDNNTPLHFAAKSGNPQSIILLSKFAAKIEAKNDSNMTPLNIAIEYKQIDNIKCLL